MNAEFRAIQATPDQGLLHASSIMTTETQKIKALSLFRIRKGAGNLNSTDTDGMNGCFVIPFMEENGKQHRLGCVASDGLGWEHVSVTDQTSPRSHLICPSWEMMCRVKRAFWDDEETVIEYHVPMSEWINTHPGCLHLWKPIGVELPRPPGLLVGDILEDQP